MVEQGSSGDEPLLSLLQQGQDNTQRLSLHTCLLERRLRGGAEPADLQVLVQDLKFAVEELQALFRAAVQAVTPVRSRAPDPNRIVFPPDGLTKARGLL